MRLNLSEKAAAQLTSPIQKKPLDDKRPQDCPERAKKRAERTAFKAARAATLAEARTAEERLRTALKRLQSTRVDVIQVAETRADKAAAEALTHETRAKWLQQEAAQAAELAQVFQAQANTARQKAAEGRKDAKEASVELRAAYTGFGEAWSRIGPVKKRRQLWDNDLRKAARDIIAR